MHQAACVALPQFAQHLTPNPRPQTPNVNPAWLELGRFVQAVNQVTSLTPQEATPYVGEALTRLRQEVCSQHPPRHLVHASSSHVPG